MLDAGYINPTPVQAKTISRMVGGQSMMVLAPQGSGKTTAFLFALLMRLKGPVDGAPRALILVSSKEKANALTQAFAWLGKSTKLRASALVGGLAGEQFMEAIEDGHADIVIGTPDKISALYVKSLLNLRSLVMMVVDDAETLVKQNQQAAVYNLAEGLTKCQRLLFTNEIDHKLDRLIEHFLPNTELTEVKESEPEPELIPLVLYKVPNHKIRLNLLEMILRDSTTIPKAVVFTNTKSSAETLYNNLTKRLGKGIHLLRPSEIDSVETFRQSPEARVLVLCNEDQPTFNLLDIPYIFHMEIPSDKSIFLSRVKKLITDKPNEAISITIALNAETESIIKLEKALGQPMKLEKTPASLLPEDEAEKGKKDDKWDWKIS